jgi:serine/threonine-protein kinase
MALREKFGRLVLLEETETGPLGQEYRAARLGPAGLDRLVSVQCFAPAVSSHAAGTKRLMDEARLAARLQNPGLVRVLGIGRVEQTFYVSTELVEGRTLAAILGRCSHDSFPFAADHALMVASRTASALEYLHSKKDDAGRALFHGLLAPSRLVVAFDGEVKIKGLGLWPALRDTALLSAGDRARLAPEQADGPGDPRSDVYALGLVMLEALSGSTPAGDPLEALPGARVVSVSGESAPLPKPLEALLARALLREPAARFATMAEMRRAIDTLLFSGDFTPTTFDLAFFMHTLFRDEMEREARAIEEARRADYREFMEERPPASAPAAAAAAAAAPALAAEVPPPAKPAAPAVAVDRAHSAEPPAALAPPPSAPTALPSPTPPPPSAPSAPSAPSVPSAAHKDAGRAPREAPIRDVTPKLGLDTAASGGSSRGIWIGLGLVALVALGVGGWRLLGRPSSVASSTATTTVPAEVLAARARVKELEDRIAQMERERAEAEAKAAEEARQKVEAQAAAKGRTVDPAALQKAQEEARQRARAEQERRQQEELARLAAARRAEEKKIAEASPSPPPATPTAEPVAPAAPAPTPTPIPTPEPALAVGASAADAAPGGVPAPASDATTPGMTVQASDPRLVRPSLVSQPKTRYPPAAEAMKVAGTVEVLALIDEAGKVAEASVTRVRPGKMGFEQAALENVRGQVYRPGTRDGVPVKVRMTIVVNFKPAGR